MYPNTLKLEKGVIAMARGDYSNYAYYFGNSVVKEGYNSAGSQFFIMTTDDYTNLTGRYAGFGKVIEGMDVLDKIAASRPELYVAALGQNAAIKALEITERLRREGKFCECDVVGRSLKAQMKYADKMGFKFTCVIFLTSIT